MVFALSSTTFCASSGARRLLDFAAVDWGMKKSGDGFDADDEYGRLRRRQRIHRMHLVRYVIFAALVLIGMLLFWH